MHTTLMWTIPFVEARFKGRKQTPKSISLSLSETTCLSGAALGIAKYWHSPSSPMESSNYVVDEEHTYQCVPDDVMAVTSPERGVVRINVCALPVFDAQFWIDSEYASVMKNTSELVALLCWTHGIPVRDIDLLDHRRHFRRGGIITNIRGAWPKAHFLALVEARLEIYKEEGGL